MIDVFWRPNTHIDILRKRAALLTSIRQFFTARDVLEVETPILARATIPDPHIESLQTAIQYPGSGHAQPYYLQTSPEFHMKRLLAAGSGAIFQISKAFRNDEAGRLHNPEFSLLEWYRPGFDHHQLMDEMDLLLQHVLLCPAAKRISYRQLFKTYLQVDIANCTITDLQHIAFAQLGNVDFTDDNIDTWLNLLMSHCIEPQLGIDKPCFVYDYPATQAALARIRKEAYAVAERFEVYVRGVELANGFHELSDAEEQRQRFQQEIEQRQQLGLAVVPMDEYLLQALASGLPDCAGVALGIDRLLLLATQQQHIHDVLAFPIDKA